MLNTEMIIIRIMWLCEIFISEWYLLINSRTGLDIPGMKKNTAIYMNDLIIFDVFTYYYSTWTIYPNYIKNIN